AHKMQISLMPESAPSIKGFDIAGFSHPTREVEGDFFDYLMMADGKIGIAVADISGKGLKGAMNAVFVNGMLHEVAKNETSCGKILSVLNSDLYPRMEKLMYCSLILAVLYQNTRKLEWANAAQPYPIIRRGDHIFELDSGGDLPLSMKQNLTYADRELELQDGDIIVFYTDGIIEATNEAKEMYEIERLEEVIANINPTMNAKEIIETIIKDVTNFVGSENQYDDITIVVVKSS
ncbi:MAG: phosphoserine phosphatase RsbU/P, partial [Candidatus Poribacteria bacterium]|nr:phosphoserine phosphatase RsbU/P [Candidatus Poribacteria bacterium]